MIAAMRMRVLVLLVGLACSACAAQPANSGVSYATYTYSCCSEFSPNLTWHVGQQVTLHWQAQSAGTTSDATAHRIALQVVLTGPFQSVDALKQLISTSSSPAGARIVKASPVWVTDRIGGTAVSQLDLPSDLAPGYYNLETRASSAGNSFSAGTVVVVVP